MSMPSFRIVCILAVLTASPAATVQANEAKPGASCADGDTAPMAESICLKNAGMRLDIEMNQVMHQTRRHLLAQVQGPDDYQTLTDLDSDYFNFLQYRKKACHKQASQALPGYPQLLSLQRCLIRLTHKRIHRIAREYPISL